MKHLWKRWISKESNEATWSHEWLFFIVLALIYPFQYWIIKIHKIYLYNKCKWYISLHSMQMHDFRIWKVCKLSSWVYLTNQKKTNLLCFQSLMYIAVYYDTTQFFSVYKTTQCQIINEDISFPSSDDIIMLFVEMIC